MKISYPLLQVYLLLLLLFSPPGVNYLGTPLPEDQKIDPFRQQVIDDYKKFMQKRRDVYKEWKSKKNFKPSNVTIDN